MGRQSHPKRMTADAGPCDFFLDPKAIWLDVDPKNANKKVARLHANDYVNGIAPQKSNAIKASFKPNKDKKTTISDPVFIKYTVDKLHYIALFDVARDGVPATCGLYVGFEVSDTPDAVAPDGKLEIPFPTDLPHYHRVTHNGHLYHIVTRELTP
jgi:hypothetical protein